MLPDGTRIAAGTVLAVNPIWMDVFNTYWQLALSIGGGVIIALTIYKLVLEIRIKRQDLNP